MGVLSLGGLYAQHIWLVLQLINLLNYVWSVLLLLWWQHFSAFKNYKHNSVADIPFLDPYAPDFGWSFC